MKKYFYSFLLFAVALVTTATFSSCSSDDDDDAPKGKASLTFQYFISEDLQKLTDVTVTGIPQLNFTNKTTLNLADNKTCAAYSSQQVTLSGQDAENADFKVTLKLKPNWQEILGDQPGVKLYYHYKLVYVESDGTTHVGTPALVAGISLAADSEMARAKIEKYINSLLSFIYPE